VLAWVVKSIIYYRSLKSREVNKGCYTHYSTPLFCVVMIVFFRRLG
jgi:hypothetical protein